MPTPNKYHSSGRKYLPEELEARRFSRYIRHGYQHPKRSFQWYSETRILPYNIGIKKANRRAEALGHKFIKPPMPRT